MNTFKQSAIEILQKSKKPLHATEITRLALECGALVTGGVTPEKTMNAQIIMDIKNKGIGSDFIKTAPGTFAMNHKKRKISETAKMIEVEKAEEEKIAIEAGFTGKGGEHLVCSELLFRGFNASIMSVDVGIDISAIKDNKFFGIQVKTSNINNIGVYNFHIRRVSFERHNQENIFYIFVLYAGKETKFLILSSGEVERKIKERAIYKVNGNTGYALSVKIRDNKVILGRGHDMSCYVNNWKSVG